MVARALGLPQKPVEEFFLHNEAASLCVLINRRTRTMRVIDFRAGPSNAKRNFVLSFAQREGVDKIYTLVERDEVATWLKLGFAKEGSIPAFYKRSDAFLLGTVAGAPAHRERDEVPTQSETRLIAAKPTSGLRPPERATSGLHPPERASGAIAPAHEDMERTIFAAKKLLKDGSPLDKALPPARVTPVREADARKAVGIAVRNGRALTTFEPFGRDVERRYFLVTSRSGFELYASTETQACFGNAYLEVLQGPKTDTEKVATTAALRALCDMLIAEGVVSCFSLAPSDDVAIAVAFLQNGFRRTGLLSRHLLIGDRRKDAILWSRKLANPGDD